MEEPESNLTRREVVATGAVAAGSMLVSASVTSEAQDKAAQTKPRQDKPKSPFDVDAKEYLGTPASEAAVQKALEFLKARQLEDGHWNSGAYTADAAIVGLCTLAYLSAGHQPGRGKYGDMLNKSVDWLSDTVQRSGVVNRSGSAGPPMYGHGFATLCLGELYGMTKRTDFRPKVEGALQLIVQTQNSEGGWRYQPTVGDADISVTTCQFMAMRAAHNGGIKVPEETVKKAIGYIKKCSNNPDGGFSYQAGTRGSGPARTGAGCTCLYLAGEGKSKECQEGMRYLLEHPIDSYEWAYKQHYSYALYYCTQAFYQHGGKEWKAWFVNIRERLIASQAADGSWKDSPGQEYATAMGILALQVPAALLPIYQK
jgi:hypothetical protein